MYLEEEIDIDFCENIRIEIGYFHP